MSKVSGEHEPILTEPICDFASLAFTITGSWRCCCRHVRSAEKMDRRGKCWDRGEQKRCGSLSSTGFVHLSLMWPRLQSPGAVYGGHRNGRSVARADLYRRTGVSHAQESRMRRVLGEALAHGPFRQPYSGGFLSLWATSRLDLMCVLTSSLCITGSRTRRYHIAKPQFTPPSW